MKENLAGSMKTQTTYYFNKAKHMQTILEYLHFIFKDFEI